MPFTVKMGTGGTTGFLGKQERTQRARRRFANRRRVKDGFPVDAPFTTREQVENYLSGDTITCLLCGRELKRLSGHLQKIHGMHPDKYRKKYGLPWRIGLAGVPTRNAYKDAAVQRIAENPDQWAEVSAMGRETGAHNFRRPPPYLIAEYTGQALNLVSREESFKASDYEEFLRRIAAGRRPVDVASDPDMPAIGTWHTYRRNHPDYDARFEAVWDALPFELQAASERLGNRFQSELRELFNKGLSDHQAAKALGVTAMTCNRITKKWRSE